MNNTELTIHIDWILLDKGKVIRAINTESYDSVSKVRPVIIEEIKVFETEAAITNLKVVPASEKMGARLIVVSNDEIQTIPLHRCYTDQVTSCRWGVCLIFFCGISVSISHITI